jgi:hypothetical protein
MCNVTRVGCWPATDDLLNGRDKETLVYIFAQAQVIPFDGDLQLVTSCFAADLCVGAIDRSIQQDSRINLEARCTSSQSCYRSHSCNRLPLSAGVCQTRACFQSRRAEREGGRGGRGHHQLSSTEGKEMAFNLSSSRSS